jgi:hypothetical protein
MIRHIFIVFCVLPILIACSIPKQHDFAELPYLSTSSCLSPKGEAKLIRTVDTCPLFSKNPQPRSEWRFVHLEDYKQAGWTPSWWNKDVKVSLEERQCRIPSVLTDSRPLPPRTRLIIEEVTTAWDYENGNRLTIRGKTLVDDSNESFIYKKDNWRPSGVASFIESRFQPCGKE